VAAMRIIDVSETGNGFSEQGQRKLNINATQNNSFSHMKGQKNALLIQSEAINSGFPYVKKTC
jgi:hypothetical protein